MEKKRKLLESETVDSVNQNVKKKKKDVKQNENDDSTNDQESFIVGSTQEVKGHEIEENRDVGSKKKRKKNLNRNESEDTTNQNGEGNSSQEILESTNSEETYNCAKNNSETSEPDGDAIHTKNPTWKKPSRNSGETKKQYKRRMRALREAGLLLDPPVVEGVKKEKRTRRKTRREKKMAKEQKNEELDKFRSIVQINYLKTWKTDPSKWKFNKNVQGKIVKHMFDASRVCIFFYRNKQGWHV